MGKPIFEETRANEASIQDLHRTYKTMIRREKQESAIRIRQRPMGRDSFGKYIYFAKRLGLIERVREEEASDIPVGRAPLLNINGNFPPGEVVDVEDREVVESRRLIYALTPAGSSASSEWDDLAKAFMAIVS
ncbi:hypothetical protein CMI37_24200 [Candidatus Pacearchaeota archaeon]|nr:hypothetical protein [Candidatus Pacearchaeota archaeon]|tara:strand:+ start:2568 stop:2966 length:399 start_codon:yes stop_codon:yes gene_type:complete